LNIIKDELGLLFTGDT